MNVFLRSNSDVLLQAALFTVMLFAGWLTPTDVVIIYALETVIIGIFHAIRMLIVGWAGKRESGGTTIAMVLFFCVHYGLFVFVQTTFFFVFLSFSDDRIVQGIGWENFTAVLGFEGVQWSIAVISASLFIRMVRNFILPGRFLKLELKEYMFVPYLRIIVQQFVAIIPGFFIILFNGGYVVALVLILLRAALEMVLNRMKSNEEFIDKCVAFIVKQSATKDKPVNPEEVRNYFRMVLDE